VRDAQPSDIRSRAGSVKGESLRKVCSVAIAVSDSLAVSDPAASPRTAAVGSNAQCEQFNDANPDHQHGECHRIIVEPISPWMHGTPPRSRPISRIGRQTGSNGAYCAWDEWEDAGRHVTNGPACSRSNRYHAGKALPG